MNDKLLSLSHLGGTQRSKKDVENIAGAENERDRASLWKQVWAKQRAGICSHKNVYIFIKPGTQPKKYLQGLGIRILLNAFICNELLKKQS